MAKKDEYIDDGHTIYNMDIDGMPHRRTSPKDKVYIEKEDKKLLIRAALRQYMPIVLGMVGCFLVAAILLYLWLL